jgi:hypothetical protein
MSAAASLGTTEPRAKPLFRRDEIAWVDAKEMADTSHSTAWLCHGLRIPRTGAPTLLAGASFAGKTVLAQSLALSCASGRDALGIFRIEKGVALVVDGEQGQALTSRRFQRLSAGIGLTLEDLGSDLRLACKPKIRLDSKLAYDAYTRLFAGVTLAIVDNLRSLAPDGDENSSNFRRYLDLLDAVAEKTRTSVICVHHTKKPSAISSDEPRQLIRGSSAIFDACGSVFVALADHGVTRITHEKERCEGKPIAPFSLRIDDVPVGNDPQGGLLVTHLDAEQLDRPMAPTAKLEAACGRIVEFLRDHGPFRGSRAALRLAVGLRAETGSAALSMLISRGEVCEDEGPVFRLATGGFR